MYAAEVEGGTIECYDWCKWNNIKKGWEPLP